MIAVLTIQTQVPTIWAAVILFAYTGLFLCVVITNYKATAAVQEDPIIRVQNDLFLVNKYFDPDGKGKDGEKLKLWCSICEVYVNNLTKHCGKCNRCAADFDHHCFWLNNCVGGNNYWLFYRLIWLYVAYSLTFLFIGIYALIERFFVTKKLLWLAIITALQVILSLVISLYLADLIRYHRWLHANDMTTFEHI